MDIQKLLSQFGVGAQEFGALGERAQQQFGVASQLADTEGQRALQQFGVGSQTFDLSLQNQQVGSAQALAGAGGAGGIAQLPLAFQQALLQAGGAASGSFFGAAGVNQNNAQLAKSPLLEAIKAAGQVAGTVSGFGGVPKVGA